MSNGKVGVLRRMRGNCGKPQILEALREAKGTEPAPAWEKLKKSELAAIAERETEGKN